MTIETYEKYQALADVYKKLAEAEKQIADGVPLLEGEQVFKRLRGMRTDAKRIKSNER